MNTAILAAVVLELTLRDVIASLPHDAGAVVVLVLLVSFAYLVWYGSRKATLERFTTARASGGEPEWGDGAPVSAGDPGREG